MERRKAGAGDFIVLGVRALLSGVAVALALGFAAIVLASNARAAGAASTDATGTSGGAALTRHTNAAQARGTPPWSAALAPSSPKASGAGALWAREKAASPAQTAATLQILLGLLALSAAAVVAVIGRGAGTPGDE
ncbi:MAG TPA: hypothetical protein VLY46_07885 [Usitatibacter sp.]|nr:hypothetical protein [Usitatibacter sp.]